MRRKLARTEAPEELTALQMQSLQDWAMAREPWAMERLPDLVDACLDYHRARGNLMADWVACARTWVRNDRRFHGGRTNASSGGARPAGRLSQAAQNIAGDLSRRRFH